jgi:hypothetical protein
LWQVHKTTRAAWQPGDDGYNFVRADFLRSRWEKNFAALIDRR